MTIVNKNKVNLTNYQVVNIKNGEVKGINNKYIRERLSILSKDETLSYMLSTPNCNTMSTEFIIKKMLCSALLDSGNGVRPIEDCIKIDPVANSKMYTDVNPLVNEINYTYDIEAIELHLEMYSKCKIGDKRLNIVFILDKSCNILQGILNNAASVYRCFYIVLMDVDKDNYLVY